MALSTSAGDAEDAAAGFTTFRGPLPEHAAEVTGLISDLYAISSSMTSLEAFSQDSRYRRNWARIHPDVELVRKSFKYTTEDIFDHFRRLDNGKTSTDNYRRVWASMDRFFFDESQYALSTRLAKYKTFLREIGDVIKDRGRDSALSASSRTSMRNLLSLQEKRMPLPSLSRLTINSRPPSRPSSRPPSRGNNAESPISPSSDRRRRRSFERIRPTNTPLSPLSPLSGAFSDSIPPSVPEAPSSPLTESVSATTATSTSTQNDSIQYHWIKEVFSSCDSETALVDSREKAGCFDEPQSGIKPILKDQGFEKILQLAFNDTSEMNTYFFLRERDHRARIVCKVPHRSRPSEIYCLPLNMLEVVQAGSCLQLCRRRNNGRDLALWARLKFTTVESMVVYFCAFLALRSQDAGRPVEDIQDHELADEEEMYGGIIIDDNYSHALRVYQHRETGAVRLQASVHKGTMHRTPVWTAFVTHNLGRRGWLKSADPRTVIVSELKLAIFMSTDDYTPPRTSRDEHILKFASRSDADSFLDLMDEIAADLH